MAWIFAPALPPKCKKGGMGIPPFIFPFVHILPHTLPAFQSLSKAGKISKISLTGEILYYRNQFTNIELAEPIVRSQEFS